MRYGIFSDIHANLEAFEAISDFYKREDIDRCLCVGDIVGYSADPVECIKIVKNISYMTVAGNHDLASVGLFSLDFFNSTARESILWTKRNLDQESRSYLESLSLVFIDDDFTLVHGSLFKPEDFNYIWDEHSAEETFENMKTDICFIGHTHIPGIFVKEDNKHISYQNKQVIKIFPRNKYIVNVGSIGQPRDGDTRASCCIYDTKRRKIEIRRVVYPVEITREKIIKANLPQSLGDRLLQGN